MLQPDPDDLGELRALVDALVEDGPPGSSVSDRPDPESATRRIGMAAELRALGDQVLRDSVERAQADHVPWQQIGDVLGISRQAAFQRFRNGDDPQGGSSMKSTNQNALIPRSEGVYHHLAQGDYPSVGQQMTFLVQRMLTEGKVMGVWSEATALSGALESLGESFVRPSGSSVVVETPLSFEAGDLVGRIAFNRRGKIVGMLLLRPEDAPSAPF